MNAVNGFMYLNAIQHLSLSLKVLFTLLATKSCKSRWSVIAQSGSAVELFNCILVHLIG